MAHYPIHPFIKLPNIIIFPTLSLLFNIQQKAVSIECYYQNTLFSVINETYLKVTFIIYGFTIFTYNKKKRQDLLYHHPDIYLARC